MKIESNNCIVFKGNGKLYLAVELKNTDVDNVKKITDTEGIKSIEIKKKSKKKSLTSNGYFWTLATELSKVINIPKGDVYIK